MTSPDTLPAAIGLPAAGFLWLSLLWPTIVDRIPLTWRQRFRRHKWVAWQPLDGGLVVKQCQAHVSCYGSVRYYNDRGVRICDAQDHLVGWCDLHYGHRPAVHFNIDADRTWR